MTVAYNAQAERMSGEMWDDLFTERLAGFVVEYRAIPLISWSAHPPVIELGQLGGI